MLKHLVNEQYEDNFRLKRRVSKLETTLKHEPSFTQPLAMKGLEGHFEKISEKSMKEKGP